MTIYKGKVFARFARSEGITDKSLVEAVRRAESGLVDGDLGSGLIKQRVARPGRGLRGGYRTLIALRTGDLAVFLYGFAKSDRDNIASDELEVLRLSAAGWLKKSAASIAIDVANGVLMEVKNDDET